MSEINVLMPRQAVPELKLPTVNGASYDLAASDAENFTMVVFYRGLHCPICGRYLRELDGMMADFAELGVKAIAVSGDDEERAKDSMKRWKLENLDLAYDLSLEDARKWGLFVSTSKGETSIGVVEPEQFSEPALYLVRPDGTLYFGTVQTMPFARPDFAQIKGAVKYVIDNDYPARGEVQNIS